MASNYWKVKKGLNLEPLATAVSVKGDVGYNSATDKLELYNGAVDPFVQEAKTQTLTNKTLSGNTAVTLISGSGTLTLNTTGTITVPNATDTLVGKATTDTLTNKTLTSPTINGATISGTFTGDLVVSGFVEAKNGSTSAPAFRFTTEADTGLYRDGGNIGTTIGSSLGPTFGTAGVQVPVTGGVFTRASNSNTYVTGDSGSGNGGEIRFYGSTHATKANYVEFLTAGTLKTTVDGSGFFNIGGVNPSTATPIYSTGSGAVYASLNTTATNGAQIKLSKGGTVNTYIGSTLAILGSGTATDTCIDASGANALTLATNDATRITISSAGQTSLGTNAVAADIITASGTASYLNVTGNASSAFPLNNIAVGANTNGAFWTSFKSRSADGTATAITVGDNLATFRAYGANGTNYQLGGVITISSDTTGGGAVSSTSMPGKITFATTPNGSNTPVNQLTISSTGVATFGTTGGTRGSIDIIGTASLGPLLEFDNTAGSGGKDWKLGDGLTIANGTFEITNTTNSTTAFRIATSTVTIGSTALDAGHIITNASATNYPVGISNRRTNTDSDSTAGMYIQKGSTTATSAQRFIQFINNDGGTNQGYITANAGTPQFTAASDRRIKKDVKPLSDCMSKIMALNPVSYTLKATNDKGIGFIAQEFNEVFPDQVDKTDDGSGDEVSEGKDPWTLSEGRLVPHLVKALQEMKSEFDAYKASHP